ncbi:MAG: polysaccharide deacetylase family protein [Sediminibacterium sp.]
MSRYVLLSFDVEEFDMPLEYNFSISPEEQMLVGKKGLDAIEPILSDPAIASTLFTTANFAMHYPEAIRQLASRHEIASHTFYHSDFKDEHLLSSKNKLEEISGKTVTGLRMPRMRKVSMQEVKKAGYAYDSSVNPTWLPGRYNNFHLPRTSYMDDGMLRVPASVSPLLRVPLFWLSFKNLPYSIFKMLALQTLKKDGYVCLYFHPWEFTDIESYGLPGFTKKLNGQPLLERLNRLLIDLKKEADFITMDQLIKMAEGWQRG